jgi:8-oxo-dGTP diphosphatase
METKHTIVCVDALTIRKAADGTDEVLLITRKKYPNIGCYAFPGGHLEYNEDPEEAVLRELKEETTLEGKNLGLITVRGKPGRDPRGHTIGIVYHIEVPYDSFPKGEDDAETAKFYPLHEVLAKKENFAFDHYEILEEFVKKQLKK